MDGGSVAAPTSIAEVEQLVKQLYLPGTPLLITQVDRQLKKLQHSSDGWQIADALLNSQDKNVRFFAALTFQIKLNNDGSKLDASTAQSVLTRVVSWTARLTCAGEGRLTLRKLCAALASYFIHSSMPWNRPLLQLAASLQHGDVVGIDQLSAAHDAVSQILPLLDGSHLITLLWLASTLAVEGTKLDSTSRESAAVHERLESMACDVQQVIAYALRQITAPDAGTLKTESLSCFLNWVNYAQPLWTRDQQALGFLQSLVGELAPLLTDADTQNEAMDVFRDILESYTSFFQPQEMELLAAIIHEHARPRMLQGLQNREPEVIPVAQLVIAYGIANIEQVVEQPNNEYGSKSIVELLLAILESPGFPGDDDEVSINSIEFWNTYIEYVNELSYSRSPDEPSPPWLEHDTVVCTRLSMLLWAKMRMPPPDIAQQWSSDEKGGFKEFRMDASDLMLSIYLRLGNGMLQQFITLALNSLAAANWSDLEASLFAVNTLADNVMENAAGEALLAQLYSSSLFRDIADFNQPIPLHVRKTAIDTLGNYGQYIERHAEFLPDTLRFLFASLENPGLHVNAAKSIESLCSTCRTSLTGELDGFLAQYNTFAQSETSDAYTQEKVIGAIAAIVQAVTPESAKTRPLTALLDIVENMAAHAKQLADSANHEAAEHMGLLAVSCLHQIGKGLQVPEDVPINLYDDGPQLQEQESFWRGQTGQAIQGRITTTCHAVLQMFPNSGECVDQVCLVLKAGIAETEPGPFVFPPSMSVSFLEQCLITTPHLESVLTMIATLVVQYSRGDQQRTDGEIRQIYHKVASFVQMLQRPLEDPSLAQCCIDVFNRMVGRYTNVLLDTGSTGEHVQPILDFCIKAIDGPDLMPKRSAADFWRRIMQPVESDDETLRSRLQQVVAAYGPALSQALMNQITGRGQRSELDQLSEPLKALISNNPQGKAWVEAALFSEALPALANTSVNDADKRRFVQQVSGRVDNRKFRDLVKSFYAACRGTVVSY